MVEQFSSSNYEQKRSYKDLFATSKNDTPPYSPSPAGLHGQSRHQSDSKL